VTVTVSGKVPLDAGAPEMMPVAGSMLIGEGSPVPDQLNGVVPPAACTAALYGKPAMPAVREVVVIERAGPMVSENCLLAVWGAGFVESVTLTFTGNVPLRLVVPLITPVPGAMESPAGNPVALQVKGAEPLADVTVAL